MRIIGGNFRGKKISLPKDKETRPLRDLVKESIFNLINHSNKFSCKIHNSEILDLFSGSGSFGLECISRNAKSVTFVENYQEALHTLKKNIKSLDFKNKIEVIEKNCFDFFRSKQDFTKKYDLIFMDPPYKEDRINSLIEIIIKEKILKKRGILIIHRHKKDNVKISEKIKILDERNYGISKIIIGN